MPIMGWHGAGGSLRFLDIRLGSMAASVLHTQTQRERERWREMFKNSLGRFSLAGRMHPFAGKIRIWDNFTDPLKLYPLLQIPPNIQKLSLTHLELSKILT
jgi:hypothetical protein